MQTDWHGPYPTQSQRIKIVTWHVKEARLAFRKRGSHSSNSIPIIRQLNSLGLGCTHRAPAPRRDADGGRHQNSKVPSQTSAMIHSVVWIHVIVHLDWCGLRASVDARHHWKDKAPWP